MVVKMHSIEPGDFDFIQSVRNRISHIIDNNGVLIDLSTESCRKYLQRKVNSKTNVVIMYVDIAGSTKMSHDLPSLSLSLIIQIFSQEVSLSIVKFGGYVLKFVGDAVIGLFPSDYNPTKAIENSLACASNIQQIINDGINPLFLEHLLPEISVKIGIEYGTAIVLLYGKNITHAHIDLIGFSISIAAKITSLAFPNEIVVGQNAYDNIEQGERKFFVALDGNQNSKWISAMKYNRNLKYDVYKYIKKNEL